MKMAWVLLIFGVVLFGLGVAFGIESNRPRPFNPMSSSSGPNILGIFGFGLFILGILISIVAGIIIERDRKNKK